MNNQNTRQNIVNFFWVIAAVLAFAVLGVLVAKIQLKYEDSAVSQGDYSVVVESAADKEKHAMITYGVAGAGLGLVVGLFNASYRQRGKF